MQDNISHMPLIGIFSLVTFILSALLTRAISHPNSKFHILDHPNDRSLHRTPVPRTGGLAICFTIVVAIATAPLFVNINIDTLPIFIGAVLIALVSYLDDRLSLNAAKRFLVHSLVAVLLIIGNYALQLFELPAWQWEWPVIIGIIFTFLFIVWMINLYNFMDGMDGFSGGMAVIGFGVFAWLGFNAGDMAFVIFNLITVSAVLGFLIFNFPPAKIFMGDTGSSTLGFLAAAFSLWASRDGIFPFWIAALIFSPFIVDATITLIKRLLKGEKVWEAHRSHYYQRLVQVGWGHKRTVLYEYLLMLLCALSAIIAVRMDSVVQWVLLVGWIVVYSLLIFYVHRLEAIKLANTS